jgi:hypothetical protein
MHDWILARLNGGATKLPERQTGHLGNRSRLESSALPVIRLLEDFEAGCASIQLPPGIKRDTPRNDGPDSRQYSQNH